MGRYIYISWWATLALERFGGLQRVFMLAGNSLFKLYPLTLHRLFHLGNGGVVVGAFERSAIVQIRIIGIIIIVLDLVRIVGIQLSIHLIDQIINILGILA